MELTTAEKIKLIMRRRGLTLGELADLTGQTRQNLSNKMSRDNFTEKEAQKIATALGCTARITFTLDDSGEML